jgi:glycosyltransferase involved in cell wall biosynthesis
MFDTTVEELQKKGHEVFSFKRYNSSITSLNKKMHAALSGIHSTKSNSEIVDAIEYFKPDIVNIHNLYPLISVSIVKVIKKYKIPIVMRIADYTSICPTSHFFRRDSVCELCSGGREYYCIKNNCKNNILISTTYALRTAYARKKKIFINDIDLYFTPSQFVKNKYISNGFPESKIFVIHNGITIPETYVDPSEGAYFAYVGRISDEKGVDILIKAATIAQKPTIIIGDYSQLPYLTELANEYVSFLGPLQHDQVYALMRKAKAIIIPSLCMESFCLSCAESMANGVPTIASDIGALPELVEHDINGILFPAADVISLSKAMLSLWENGSLTRRLGYNSRIKALNYFSREKYINEVINLYNTVL